MTVSKSPRLGLTRWSADTDPWNRADWDDDNAALEALALGALVGLASARPAAAATNARMLHYATDNGTLSYSTGSAWFDLRVHYPPAPAFAIASNNTTGTLTGYRRNSMTTLVAALTASTAIAANVNMGTLAAEYHPAQLVPIVGVAAGALFLADVSPAGGLTARTAVAQGTAITFLVTYPVA